MTTFEKITSLALSQGTITGFELISWYSCCTPQSTIVEEIRKRTVALNQGKGVAQ